MGLLNEFSIQLYSVKDETAKDFAGTLRRVAGIGYTGVEFAGYGDVSAKEMKSLLDECGMKSVGSHVGLVRLTDFLDEEIEYNATIGTKYIICPWSEIKNREETLRLAQTLAPVAEKVAKAGMKFAYHNHAHEFDFDGEERLLDILFENSDKSKMLMELDLYWTAYAGVDIEDYISKNRDICKLVHLKQIKDMESKKFVDLEDGAIDYKSIITAALSYGVKEFVLEQEEFEVSPYVSLERNFKYILSL